jgi:hypothetical protein
MRPRKRIQPCVRRGHRPCTHPTHIITAHAPGLADSPTVWRSHRGVVGTRRALVLDCPVEPVLNTAHRLGLLQDPYVWIAADTLTTSTPAAAGPNAQLVASRLEGFLTYLVSPALTPGYARLSQLWRAPVIQPTATLCANTWPMLLAKVRGVVHDARGIYCVARRRGRSTLQSADCVSNFTRTSPSVFEAFRSGGVPGVAAYMYDAVAAFALALDAIDNVEDPDALVTALRALNFDGASGPVAFKQSGTLDRMAEGAGFVVQNAYVPRRELHAQPSDVRPYPRCPVFASTLCAGGMMRQPARYSCQRSCV